MDERGAMEGFGPVAAGERIQAMDVLRGLALLGIALMNVEFFNRPLSDLGAGMPADLHGADLWASWIIHTFVRGKFWTMFSILFGMGFAVMLLRARQSGRAFVPTYLRRALALAGFGLVHGVLIWEGDILLGYATGALVLLLALFGRVWQGLAIAAAIGAVAWLLALPQAYGFVAVVGMAGLVGLYLRRRGPAGLRPLRAGLALYLVPVLLLTVGAAISMVVPRPAVDPAQTTQSRMRVAEHQYGVDREERAMSTGSYAEAVAVRAPQFGREYLEQAGFMAFVLGLFLIGMWLVECGAMQDPQRHLPLFRGLAWMALPLGIVLVVASSLVATHHTPLRNDREWQLAMGLQLLGNLPMTLGYMAVVVLALQRAAWQRVLAWLAPMGRMALTNYLMQSVLGTLFFYGYGLGHWGMPRAQQVAYVLVVFVLQLLLSRWWLARFRFGPLEWLWRWATYGRRPSMRIAA